MSHGLGFAVLCIVVPCFIGSVMYGTLGLWDRLRRKRADGEGLPNVDYLI